MVHGRFGSAKFEGAVADKGTRWPEKFDLQAAGVYDIGPRSNLSGANLAGVDLSGVDLSGADLTNANVLGTDLSWADLTQAILSGATADEETIWPEGFDPVAAEVIFK
jgi:uncharacterized protein YjbI with pentapeptide repeats